ncbi:hypothetical protein DL763_007738 [Monosporascus cannonballus]|nr:hypothetical protein DL763_007738 [Monosporascus cannonballus]
MRIWLSRRSRMLLIQIILMATILFTNFGLTAFAVSQFGSSNGVGLIYDGDCDTVRALDLWTHLLINLLSTGMLSASNYCMQLQAAPTRADVERAHNDGKWLDIGVPSLRNLRYISFGRRLSWALLALSSVPVHLMCYHCSSWSLATAEANRKGDKGWDESRVNPPELNYTVVIQGMQDAVTNDEYEELDVSAWFRLYEDYWAPQGNAVILVANESVQMPADDSLLMYVSVIPRPDNWAKNMWALGNGTGNWVAMSPDYNVTKWYLGPKQYEVKSCLVQPPEGIAIRCRFEDCPPIMIAICALNLIKASVMLSIWALGRWQQSRKQEEDKEPKELEESPSEGETEGKYRTKTVQDGTQVVDGSRESAALVYPPIHVSSGHRRSIYPTLPRPDKPRAPPDLDQTVQPLGPGLRGAEPVHVPGDRAATRGPGRAGVERDAGEPAAVGALSPRSSYFISLPLRYGLPLYATSGFMYWLVSQSLFLARITAMFPDGTVDVRNSFSTCGASPIAVFIRLQDHKRHRSEVFVYRRQGDEAPFAQIPTPPQKPVIHISQPSGQDATFQRPKRRNTFEDASDNDSANDLPTTAGAGGTSTVKAPEPRRFHLSRPDAMLSASEYHTPTHGGVSKKRSAPALFVERRIKRLSARTVEKLQSTPNTATAQDLAPTSEQNVPGSQSTPPASGVADVGEVEPRKYKKPGVARLASKGATPKAKTQLPQSMINRWNVDMDRMAEEMNVFALEQIGLNLQKAEEEQKQRLRSPKGGQSTAQLKYKPKAPTKRYSERHPEPAPERAAESADKEMADPDVGLSETDDEEYVIETYVRVPASKMGDNVPPQNVGLLVFDEEPDIAYFYGESSDSEDEWAEDEEDENAENYYTADYPDDEVASDDEYDINVYAYRTGNASDLEEYDVEDEYDDPAYDSDGVKGGFKTYVGRNGFTTNHLRDGASIDAETIDEMKSDAPIYNTFQCTIKRSAFRIHSHIGCNITFHMDSPTQHADVATSTTVSIVSRGPQLPLDIWTMIIGCIMPVSALAQARFRLPPGLPRLQADH